MDALPYVDSLFKEYLLFRGFTATLQMFNHELAQDKASGFQAERITELIFRKLIPELQVKQLVEFLDFLNMRFYSRLDMKFESTCRRMEVSILRYLLVKAVKLGRQDKVQEFFQVYGSTIMSAKDPEDWRPWFCLAYVREPHKDPIFQVYFTNEWVEVLEVSYRNFISEVLRILPLPAVLRFNTDRLARQHLQQQVETLQSEVRSLQRQHATQPSPSLSPSASIGSDASLSLSRRHFSSSRRVSSADEEGTDGESKGRRVPGDSAFVQQKKSVFTKVRTRSDLPVVPEQEGRMSHPPSSPSAESPAASSPLPPARGNTKRQGHHRREASLADWTGPEGFETLNPNRSPPSSTPNTPPAAAAAVSEEGDMPNLFPATSAGNGTGHKVHGGGDKDNTGSADTPDSDPSTPHLVTSLAPFTSPTTQEDTSQTPPLPPPSATPSTAPVPPTTLPPSSTTPHTSSSSSNTPTSTLPSSQTTNTPPVVPPVALAGLAKRTSSGGASSSSAVSGSSTSAYALLDSYVKSTQQASPRRIEESESGGKGSPGRLKGSTAPAQSSPPEAASASTEAKPEAEVSSGDSDPHADAASTDTTRTTTTSIESWDAPTQHSKYSRPPSSAWSHSSLDIMERRFERVVTSEHWELVLQHDDTFMEHSHPITCCRMSPAGANSASASTDGAVTIWTPPRATGNPGRNTTLNIGACVSALTWDERADKVMLLGTCGRGIKAWHVDTKRMTADITCDPSWPDVLDITCCPTDPMFVCSSTSSALRIGTPAARGRVTLWNMRSFRKVQTFMIPGEPVATCVSYSRSGRLVATACFGGKLNIFDTTGGRATPEKSWQVGPPGSRVFVRFTDTTVLTFSGGKIQEWVLQGARTPVRTFDLTSVCSDDGPVVEAANCHRFAISHDQSILAATTDIGDLALVDLRHAADDQKGVSLLKLGMPGGLCAVDWHPLEDVVLCGSVAGPISTLNFERSNL